MLTMRRFQILAIYVLVVMLAVGLAIGIVCFIRSTHPETTTLSATRTGPAQEWSVRDWAS